MMKPEAYYGFESPTSSYESTTVEGPSDDIKIHAQVIQPSVFMDFYAAIWTDQVLEKDNPINFLPPQDLVPLYPV